ncbi:hypothetical protein ACET3Z_006361 [Daucus carota]
MHACTGSRVSMQRSFKSLPTPPLDFILLGWGEVDCTVSFLASQASNQSPLFFFILFRSLLIAFIKDNAILKMIAEILC